MEEPEVSKQLEFAKKKHSRQRSVWAQQSACQGATIAEQKLYWSGDYNKDRENVKTFKEICASCPVLEQCRDYARLHEKYGNIGGETLRERNKWRRKHPSAMIDLLFDAVKYDWLEPHNVCGAEDVQDVLNLANLRTSQPQAKKIDPATLIFETLDWGNLFSDYPQPPKLSPKESAEQILALAEKGPLAGRPGGKPHPIPLPTDLDPTIDIGSLHQEFSYQDFPDAL